MNETEVLFSHILDCGRLSLYLDSHRYLAKQASKQVARTLKHRAIGEPIEYILGRTEFYGLPLTITKDVFIPRPETEILVEEAIKVISSIEYPCLFGRQGASSIDVLDLCTGSGCIAVALAKSLPHVKITATDVSFSALGVAEKNAEINRVPDRIAFLKSDLFESLQADMRYAVCVCNPPYIASLDIPGLMPEVQFQPRISLDGGKDGLDFYRKAILSLPRYLQAGGFLIMEIGFNQRKAIEEIFKKTEKFEIIEVIQDYNSIERVIVAKLK